MAYTPTLWAKGDKVTSAKLNKIEQGIVDKVDKETGKTLSTNDFTDAYKTKLEGIEANADKTTIDATLTNSGAAADAKATGDAINNIENDLDGKVVTIESNLDEKVENLKSLVGTPLRATTASNMTDTSKIYVYTGNESGYTNGDWYYHDGSAWVDGGTYNSVAVEVDKTLTVDGMPADAKATGDEISDLKEDLNSMTTATSDDVGKALKAKTVTDGKVTEWEFGEAGGSGLAEDGKQALLAIARSVVYSTPNGQELYDALYNAFYPPANLIGITAVYTQSGTVTTTSSLDSLKKDLVVNAVYSDGTIVGIDNYALSGTLVSGTSTITVTYSGKTATFTVNVIEALYMLPESTVFDGTNYIDTGVKLASMDRSYTIMLDETNGSNSTTYPIFHCMTESSPYPGLGFQVFNSTVYGISGFARQNVRTLINAEPNGANKVVLRHEAESQYLYVDFVSNGVRGEQVVLDNGGVFAQSDNNLLIGCYQTANGDKGRFWKGIISDFVILSNVIDDNAVTEYLGV